MQKKNHQPPPPGYVGITADGDLQRILGATHLNYLATSSDDAGVVLRSHLVTEECLNLWVRKVTRSPSIFKSGFFAYKSKLEMANNLDHPESVSKVFEKLNGLRNRFGHQIDAQIHRSDVDALKNLVDAVPSSSMEWGTPIVEGLSKDGVTLRYDDAKIADRQRLSIVLDVLVVKTVLIYQTLLAHRGETLAI